MNRGITRALMSNVEKLNLESAVLQRSDRCNEGLESYPDEFITAEREDSVKPYGAEQVESTPYMRARSVGTRQLADFELALERYRDTGGLRYQASHCRCILSRLSSHAYLSSTSSCESVPRSKAERNTIFRGRRAARPSWVWAPRRVVPAELYKSVN